MPKYDYICPDCRIEVEISVRYEQSDTITVRCCRCGRWMTRQIQQIPITFNGHGFYCTDNQEEHKEEG